VTTQHSDCRNAVAGVKDTNLWLMYRKVRCGSVSDWVCKPSRDDPKSCQSRHSGCTRLPKPTLMWCQSALWRHAVPKTANMNETYARLHAGL